MPKGASRKKSSSTTTVISNTPASSSHEEFTDSTCTVGTQCEIIDLPPAQLTTTEDESVQATIETLDACTQTEDVISADELQDEAQPVQNNRICEGNSDIKLVIKHNGIFTNSQGVSPICRDVCNLYFYRLWSSGIL